MAKQNITVKIIGKPYPLAIDGEKEELYRLAEREINAYVTRIEQAHFKGFSKEDCLAMAAFQIAVAKLALAQSREVGDEEVKRRRTSRSDASAERKERDGRSGANNNRRSGTVLEMKRLTTDCVL